MLSKSSRLKTSSKFAAHLRSATIMFRVICIFSAAAFLLIIQVKAQEKADEVNALVQQLRSQDPSVRSSAADALAQIGKEAVPALVDAFKDQDRRVLLDAAFALGKIGKEAKEAVPALIDALKDQDDASLRSSAASALAQIGEEAKEAAPALIDALKDQNAEVRRSAAYALEMIAKGLFDSRSTEMLPQLKTAYEALKDHSDATVKDKAAEVKRTIDYFESLWWVEARERAVKIAEGYPYISATGVIYLLFQFTWLLLFWLRPLSLLNVITATAHIGVKPKIFDTEIPITLKWVVVFPAFYFPSYRPRLLDAWVGRHFRRSARSFMSNEIVKSRALNVALPMFLNGRKLDALSPKELQSIFDSKVVNVLITGEGGGGKTSLACQMGKWAMHSKPEKRLCRTHRMLPILITGELDKNGDGKPDFLETIRGRLKKLIDERDPISRELLTELLRGGRTLVIADSFSEWKDEAREKVKPAEAEFSVSALIITSRIDEWGESFAKTRIRPRRLQGSRLVKFMEDYFERRGKRKLLDEMESFDACKQISELNSFRKVSDQFGESELTVLIAKLYADAIIASKEDRGNRNLPKNIPDLMLSYPKILNENAQATEPDNETVRPDVVQRVAKILAWECLRQNYRPSTVQRVNLEKVLSAKADSNGQMSDDERKAEKKRNADTLRYFEKRLRLIQPDEQNAEVFRFSLDPVAEYLAGFYLVEQYGKNEDLWREFFENAERQPGTPETIKGFLLAVHDCCAEKGVVYDVPEWVGDKLAQLAGLDEEATKTVHLRQRIKLLLANLSSPDDGDRIRAAEALGQIGPPATEAVPALISTLKNRNANVTVTAATALGQIGQGGKEVVLALIVVLNDQDGFVRKSAAEALGKFGLEAEEAVPALIAALGDPDPTVSREAADALGKLGPPASKAVPALITALMNPHPLVRESAIRALGMIGAAGTKAVPDLINALRDTDVGVRESAADTLGNLGELAGDAVPALVNLFEDAKVRSRAEAALQSIGPARPSALPDLVAALSNPNPGVRSGAAGAIGNVVSPSAESIAALIIALGDKDRDVCSKAEAALIKIGSPAEPLLVGTLGNADQTIHVSSIRILGKLGPTAIKALPVLLDLLDDAIQLSQRQSPAKWGCEINNTVIQAFEVIAAVSAALGRIGPAEKVKPILAAVVDNTRKALDLCPPNAWGPQSSAGRIGPPNQYIAAANAIDTAKRALSSIAQSSS